MTRVVVSGLGVVSPYGAGAKTFWAGLSTGECAIRPLTVIDTEFDGTRLAFRQLALDDWVQHAERLTVRLEERVERDGDVLAQVVVERPIRGDRMDACNAVDVETQALGARCRRAGTVVRPLESQFVGK